MTRATAYFLTRLREYLASQPASKRRELARLHEKIADGKKLYTVALSRHLNLVYAPTMDTALVYLRFAQVNGLIETGAARETLFRSVNATVKGETPAKTKG